MASSPARLILAHATRSAATTGRVSGASNYHCRGCVHAGWVIRRPVALSREVRDPSAGARTRVASKRVRGLATGRAWVTRGHARPREARRARRQGRGYARSNSAAPP
jgi:hypothetical protein